MSRMVKLKLFALISILIAGEESNALSVDLGPDTTLCSNAPYWLIASTTPGLTYLWQDGSTDSIYGATDPGTYWVEVTDGNTTVRDTVVITHNLSLSLDDDDINVSSEVCDAQGAILSGAIEGIEVTGPTPLTYAWHDENDNIVSNNAGLTNVPAGLYTFHVTDSTGCEGILGPYILNSADTIDALAGPDTTIDFGFEVGLYAYGASVFSWASEQSLS